MNNTIQELQRYITSGNEIPVKQATIPAELVWAVIKQYHKYENQKYFVGSNGDAPEQLYFDLDSAKKDENKFIDFFDSNGLHINSLKFDNSLNRYTEYF